MDASPTPPWLKILDRFAASCSEAALIDAATDNPGEAAETVSSKQRAIEDEMVLQMAYVPDIELARAYLCTDGVGLRADALCVVMQRRKEDP